MRRRDTATAVVCLLWIQIRVRRGVLALKRKNYLSNRSRQKKARLRMTSKNQYEQSQGSFATRTHGLRFSKGDCSLKWRPPRPDACRRICVAAMGMPRPCCTGSREISVQIDCEYYEIHAKNAYLARKVFEESKFNNSQERYVVYQTASKNEVYSIRGQHSREKLCNFARHKRRQKY